MKKTYIIILFLFGLLTLTTCHKDKEIETKSPVVSGEEMTVAETQATITWAVEFTGRFSTGVDVSTHENMSGARRVEATKEDGKYVAVVDDLATGTKYYYRIVVWNKYGNFEEERSEFVTEEKTFYQVTATCSPTEGGRVTGAGSYEENKYCTLNAISNQGYDFVNWTENGNPVSTNANYTFKVAQNRNLVAHFAKQKFTVSVSATPSAGGTVSGGGQYDYGQSCTVSATAASGYTFSEWTEDGNQVSTNANYTFTVNSARTLVAHFTELQGDEYNVNVSANPSDGGTVTGGGVFQAGASCTVTATANTGYTFANWTENGSVVSSSASYTFTVNANRTLVANFTAQSYTISVSANPSAGGSATGGGTYHYGETCTVSATPNTGFTFVNWRENGSFVSSDAEYSFVVNGDRTLVAHFATQAPNEYTITVTTDPTNGGTVSGGGTYQEGQSCTVTATASSGYTFTNWTENGTQVSTDANYTFTVTGNRNLVAHFEAHAPNSYTITITLNPTDGGTVTGAGTYLEGETCTVSVEPNYNFSFGGWWENNQSLGWGWVESFTVTCDRDLEVRFYQDFPTGVINGLYSISATQQVYFSRGNLQYNAAQGTHQCADGTTQQGTWRFAENQWDYIGEANSNISHTYDGWIDLFGWGTSGWNCGNTYYHPWDSDHSGGSLYGPPGEYNLTGSYANSDWGRYNTISNGGSFNYSWRTLTQEEWDYVLNTRSTVSGIRYAKAQVNDVNGVILLPDDWNSVYYHLNDVNTSNSSYINNYISLDAWSRLELYGAVFLPTAGSREGTMIAYLGNSGMYWSASYIHSPSSYWLDFADAGLNTNGWGSRYYGMSVRLVCPAQ